MVFLRTPSTITNYIEYTSIIDLLQNRLNNKAKADPGIYGEDWDRQLQF